MYGEDSLLRLQQILFYRELGFPLNTIADLLDDEHFDTVESLKVHKQHIAAEVDRLRTLMNTIDTTISNLKNDKKMTQPAKLYEGFSDETAQAYRSEAVEKYGKKAVETSENELSKLNKKEFKALKAEFEQCNALLFTMRFNDPQSDLVQAQIAKHYELIRRFWGTSGTPDPQADAYAGLGKLYTEDLRFTKVKGEPQAEFARFLCKAMTYFATHKLP
jgi:DNA-binding transcriptional MerR regulator